MLQEMRKFNNNSAKLQADLAATNCMNTELCS